MARFLLTAAHFTDGVTLLPGTIVIDPVVTASMDGLDAEAHNLCVEFHRKRFGNDAAERYDRTAALRAKDRGYEVSTEIGALLSRRPVSRRR